MKIKRIILQNFGPYYGVQKIDLETNAQSPVVIIYGENMRGKTSFLRGIRWALYGTVNSHEGEELSPGGFANYDACAEQTLVPVSVEIVFDESGEEISLKRSMLVEGDELADDPKARSVSELNIFLKPANGPAMPTKDIPEAIAKILHSEVSDFFLFDGETLSDFERKLRSKESKSVLVRSSIERILGLQGLQLLRNDILHFQELISADLKRIAKQDKRNKEALDELAKIDDDLRTHEEDLLRFESLLTAVKVKISEIEQKLKSIEDIRDSLIRRGIYEEELKNSKSKIALIQSQISDLLSKVWWIPLGSWVEQEISLIDESLSSYEAEKKRKIEIDFQISQLRKQLETRSCSVCGEEFSESSKNRVKEEIVRLERSLEIHEDSHPDISLLQTKKSQLKLLSPAINSQQRLRDLDQDLGAELLHSDQIQININSLSEIIQGNTISVTAEDKLLQDNKFQAMEIERAMAELVRNIETKRDRQRILNRDLAANAGSENPYKTRGLVLDYLFEVLEGSLDQFKDLMRKSVEIESTKIFKQLSTEPEYDGIRITPKYLIELVDKNQRIMERPSAGAQQILAMSFIGALVHCAVRRGPVIMDTPFGRLDIGHKRSILGWVPTLGTQVVLLVQSGEFDRQRDLEYLNNQVTSEFVLQRVSATRTEIIDRKNLR